MVVAMMVLLVLAGLGLIAIRFVHMETASGGYARQSRSAMQVANSALIQVAGFTEGAGGREFHERAMRNNPAAPTYTFPTGHFTNTADSARLGSLDYSVTMRRPRQANCPSGFQVGGSSSNKMICYIYEFDVVGTVNGDPVTRVASPGGGSAVKQLRADVRVGPFFLQQ